MLRLVRFASVALIWLLIANVGLAAETPSDGQIPVEGGLTSDALALDPVLFSQMETRASLGLPADRNLVQALSDSANDAGKDLGYPLTNAERAYVDGVGLFVSQARTALLPAAEELPSFVDAYFDHSRGGLLVLQFTSITPEERAALSKAAPGGPGVEIVTVEHNSAELYEAMMKVWELWPADSRKILVAVSVDPRINGLTLEVANDDFGVANSTAGTLASDLGMNVGVELTLPAAEVVCTSRTNCHTPLRGGVRIDATVSGVTRLCTMGFHVRISGDDQFVSAGHCGHNAASATWRHLGLGNIGVRTATQYAAGGRDIMRVQMSNSQDSSLLYSGSINVTSDLDPYLGEPVCAYRGISSTVVSCGTITDNVTSWTGDACGCTVNGGDTSIGAVGGDSGSPIVDQNARQVAIGLLNTSSGLFARVDDALNAWGAVIRTP